jgi:methylmalonyl-CoA mutase
MHIQSIFPPVSKADWLAQVAKDLKGAPLESLHWQVSEGVIANPRVAAEDLPSPLYPLSETPNNWEITEYVFAEDAALANAQALEALRAGAEGICFHLNTPPDEAFFSVLLQDIYLDYIGLHFEGPVVAENPSLILALLDMEARKRGISKTDLRGSLHYAPLQQAARTDWRFLADFVRMARVEFPGFKVLTVEETDTLAPETALSDLLIHVQTYIKKLSELGVSPSVTAAAIRCKVQIGVHYFVEIARLRAFEILWLNLLKGWSAPLEAPVITAVFNPAAYSDAVFTNMIKATTMAMSAALGGATQITVLPYDEGREHLTEYPKAFARRIARNVQHLLKLESNIHTLSDPAAGSYYVEHLTHQIARASWEQFSTAP